MSTTDSSNQDTERIKAFDAEVNRVIALIGDAAKADLPNEAEYELGKSLEVIAKIRELEAKEVIYLKYFDVIINALLAKKPNIVLASRIRRELEDITNTKNKKRFIAYRRLPPPVRVISGLLFMLILMAAISVVTYAFSFSRETFLGMQVNIVLPMVVFGALGSIVSIMTRIRDFKKSWDESAAILFLIGFFRPVIGMCFAIFVYITVKAEIIPLKPSPDSKFYYDLSLAFVSGFSERFGTDVVSKAEAVLGKKNT